MASQAINSQSFASGLDSFGSIDWDAEYDELVAAEDETESAASPQPATAEPITTGNAPSDADSSPNWTIISNSPSSEHEAAPEASYQPPADPFLSWEHPGWTMDGESASWASWTSTSPEVCLWAQSPRIQDDAQWVLSCGRHLDDYTHNDIPRVASVLRRAYAQVYVVREGAGIAFPWSARGLRTFYRADSQRPPETFRKGGKGLKEEGDPEIAMLGNYVPLGEIAQLRAGKYFPQRSRMEDVWCAEDVVVEGEKEEEEMLEEQESSEEEEWAAFCSSSEDEGAERPLNDSLNTSVESLAAAMPEEELCVINDDEDEDTTTQSVSPTTTFKGTGTDAAQITTALPFVSPVTPSTTLISELHAAANNGEDIAAPSIPPTTSTTLLTTTAMTSDPRTSDRSPSPHLHEETETAAPPNPKLMGHGRSRSSSTSTDLMLPSPPSLTFFSPTHALRDTASAKKLAPAKTLFRGFAAQHGGMGVKGQASHADTWKNRVAAAVAVVGGIVAFIG